MQTYSVGCYIGLIQFDYTACMAFSFTREENKLPATVVSSFLGTGSYPKISQYMQL